MMRSIYQEQQCAQSTNISSVEDGSRKESVATQTTQAKAKPDRSINKLQYKIIFHELKNLVPVGSGKIKLFVLM